MSAYAPHDAINLWGTVAILAATLALGYAITRAGSLRISRIAAWILFVLAVVGVERLNSREPAGFRMLAIIGALLYSMKAVVAVEARALGAKPLHVRNWFCFAALWPGMRPGPFTRPRAAPQPDAVPLLIRGMVRLVCGFILVALARLTWDETRSLFITTALILPGVSFILHFGIFNLVAGLWRLAGVDCQPLFRDPLRSTSLAEFWGRRWNLAFSEMLALAVYQPLVRRAGRRPAVAVAFLGSGLLHELAISLPVKAGYGLPFGYFVLHGSLMMVEGRLAHIGRPIDRVPWFGRAWTLAWLLLPLPILFHRPFLAGVVWPLIGIER